jgi:general secretion pathway protein E
MDDTIRTQVMQQANAHTIKTTALQHGMRTLLQDGARKVLQGVTTAAEVLRVTQESE